MARLKSVLIFSIEFLLIICSIIGVAYGINSNYNESVQSGDTLNSESSNVNFDNYNYLFGLNSYGNTVITRYGKLPVLETEGQKENWNSNLEELGNKIKETIASKYMYPHGEVLTCGTNSQGYFLILFKYGNVDEPLMNELYTLIDNSAKEIGMQEIPVEFGYGIYQAEIPLDRKHGIYHTYGENVENLSESDIQSIEEYMKEKPEQLGGGVASYGKIPLLKDKRDIHSWFEKLSSIKNSTDGKILPYLNKSQVVAYGMELTRLDVSIYDGLPSEEKTALVKEIYQIIDEEARKQSVTDVPVVFRSGYYRTDEEVIEDEGAIEDVADLPSGEKSIVELNNSNNNDSESDNGSSPSENDSSKNNSTPGFVLFESLICLYGVWKFRKK